MNQENVVKVGHRQVVNMIRQGGNRLLIKVVTVSRNLDPEDTARKKGELLLHRCSSPLGGVRKESDMEWNGSGVSDVTRSATSWQTGRLIDNESKSFFFLVKTV